MDPEVWGWIFTASLLMFLASLVIVPLLIVRLPAGYFSHRRPGRTMFRLNYPVFWWIWHLAKGLLGAVLVLAGILMLVFPGQGILTILVGLSLLDFPGKYRLERWLVQRPLVLTSINRLRRKFGRAPLTFDIADTKPTSRCSEISQSEA